MRINESVKPIEILMVDDNPDDVKLTIEALEGWMTWSVNVASDGEEALGYLRKEEEYAKAITPELILLDLNMPGMDGHEVLAEIKSDEVLRSIPVVMLTTSEAAEDILRAYELRANCYVTKPVDLDQFTKLVQAIDNFWFSIVKLP